MNHGAMLVSGAPAGYVLYCDALRSAAKLRSKNASKAPGVTMRLQPESALPGSRFAQIVNRRSRRICSLVPSRCPEILCSEVRYATSLATDATRCDVPGDTGASGAP